MAERDPEATDVRVLALYRGLLGRFGLADVDCPACARALLPEPLNFESYTYTTTKGRAGRGTSAARGRSWATARLTEPQRGLSPTSSPPGSAITRTCARRTWLTSRPSGWTSRCCSLQYRTEAARSSLTALIAQRGGSAMGSTCSGFC